MSGWIEKLQRGERKPSGVGTFDVTHEGFTTRVVLVSPSKSSRAFPKTLSLVIPNERRVVILSMMSPSKLRISSHW